LSIGRSLSASNNIFKWDHFGFSRKLTERKSIMIWKKVGQEHGNDLKQSVKEGLTKS
jgi:hypothetical protein